MSHRTKLTAVGKRMYPLLFFVARLCTAWAICLGIAYVLMRWPGQLSCVVIALCGTAAMALLQYYTVKTLRRRWPSIKSTALTSSVQHVLHAGGIDYRHIAIKYGFYLGSPAAVLPGMVMLDPFVWHVAPEDEAEQVAAQERLRHMYQKEVFWKRYEEMLPQVRHALTVPAQQFILHHELAHLIHRDLVIRNWVELLLYGIEWYVMANILLYYFFGFIAFWQFFLLLITLTILHRLILNLLISRPGEVKADMCAARACSDQEILAGAQFFVDFETIANKNKKKYWWLQLVPRILISGHPAGAVRARYLRAYVARHKKELEAA